jgi:hypothetical protein
VQAANHALRRTGLGVLDERSRDSWPTEIVIENLRVERPGEQPTLVPERLRDKDENAYEVCTFNMHMEMLS